MSFGPVVPTHPPKTLEQMTKYLFVSIGYWDLPLSPTSPFFVIASSAGI